MSEEEMDDYQVEQIQRKMIHKIQEEANSTLHSAGRSNWLLWRYGNLHTLIAAYRKRIRK